MCPAPVPKHRWVSSNIKIEIRNAIKKAGGKSCRRYDFIDIKVSEDTIVQPKAVAVSKEITQIFLAFPAAPVVEILSPSIAMKDRNINFIFQLLYAFGISFPDNDVS